MIWSSEHLCKRKYLITSWIDGAAMLNSWSWKPVASSPVKGRKFLFCKIIDAAAGTKTASQTLYCNKAEWRIKGDLAPTSSSPRSTNTHSQNIRPASAGENGQWPLHCMDAYSYECGRLRCQRRRTGGPSCWLGIRYKELIVLRYVSMLALYVRLEI